MKDADQHDFGHQIHTFRFAADVSPEQERKMYPKEMKTRKALGIDDPLRGMKAGTDFCESADYIQTTQTDWYSGLHVPM